MDGVSVLAKHRYAVHDALKFFKCTADEVQAARSLPTELKTDLVFVLVALVVFHFDRDFTAVVGEGEEVRDAGEHTKALQLDVILDFGLPFVGDVKH